MSYKADETLLLKYLGDSPTLRIIDFFLDNPLSDYSKNEVANNLAMSRATFFKYWKELEKSDALIATRKIGRATLYKLDRTNEIVKQLINARHDHCTKRNGKTKRRKRKADCNQNKLDKGQKFSQKRKQLFRLRDLNLVDDRCDFGKGGFGIFCWNSMLVSGETPQAFKKLQIHKTLSIQLLIGD